MPFLVHLVEEVLAVWSVSLHDPAHLVDSAVQPPQGYELRELPAGEDTHLHSKRVSPQWRSVATISLRLSYRQDREHLKQN